MDSVITKLSGNLGERHHCFNALVQESYSKSTSLPLQTHLDEPALDRLFKIDLASKQRNVDFIIHTLKDGDMLYVNRALKSLWLLEPEYSNIINPTYLENELFPHMILPAVNKMRHWIQMHLQDPQRCEEFHQLYKERDVDLATNFLWHCTNEYVLCEIGNVLDKITPKLLKRLSEKNPQITKMYYDSLKHNQTLLKYYLQNDSKFFANLKYLLKTDANVFFHVLENFFVPQKFAQLSAAITKYIIKHHKCRFLWKPELYAAWFLDMATLARCLSSDEIKDLVLKLARAEYLQSWFSFQRVEILIKHIKKEERGAFKTLVFVDKAFAPMVTEWQYPIPVPPVLPTLQKGLFDDTPSSYHPDYYLEDIYDSSDDCDRRKRHRVKKSRAKTLLEDLFEKYRFFDYEQTFAELQKQLKAESSAKNRQFMLLVLVSKTGGRIENVVHLLDLLYQHKNEPVQIRATLFRSLVKRACVWRLPSEHWRRLLEWGHGLGLDGNAPEANCLEGRDAIVIRDLLAGLKPNATIWDPCSYYFHNLHEYPFTPKERSCIRARLPLLLIAQAQSETDNYKRLILIKNLLDTLQAYRVKYDEIPGVVETVVMAFRCKEDSRYVIMSEGPESFLQRLYDAGVARKHLIKEYFEMLQTDASYVNALRHDISLLDETDKLEKLIDTRRLKHDKFFRKLALYFMEKDGLGERYRAVLARRAAVVIDKPPLTRCRRDGYSKWIFWGNKQGRPIIAMPLAKLSGSIFLPLLAALDISPPKSAHRQIAAALRANAHIVRPAIDLESFGWRKAGVKWIANRIAVCRQTDTEQYLQKCLAWRRTLRLALVPAKRVCKERNVFERLASERPGTALQAALLYFRRERTNPDLRIWDMVKSRILKTTGFPRRSLINLTHTVPAIIKAEYCILVYEASKNETPHFRSKAFTPIPALLPEIDEQYIFNAISGFMSDCFKDSETIKSMIIVTHRDGAPYYLAHTESTTNVNYIHAVIEVIAKFLVLCKSEEKLDERYIKVALPFLNGLEIFWKQFPQSLVPTERFLNSFLYYLRYNKVYFDVNYVSCLPVLKRISEWMQGFLPIEKWFEMHVEINLTMIYLKSARHCLEQNPALISKHNKLKGSQMLGTVFGKYVANEIDELTQKYFLSITELYKDALLDYYYNYIYRKNDDCFEKFTVAFVHALINNNSGASCILAKHVFLKFRDHIRSDHVSDILKVFQESEVPVLRVF